MAKLWEDSVVTAIRDEKWLHALRHGAPSPNVPLPQLKMKGNAEQRLGDILDVLPEERFILIEVKAERGDISDEWKTSNASKEHKKDALRALRRWSSNLRDSVNVQSLSMSMKGHVFAYWVDEGGEDDLSVTPLTGSWSDLLHAGSGVVITPYIIGCVEVSQETGADIFPKIAAAWAPAVSADQCCFFVRQHIPLSTVYEGMGYVVTTEPHENTLGVNGFWKVGLTLKEMEVYVARLCKSAGASFEEIHAILLSTSGRFFRVLRTTADLADVIAPTIDPGLRRSKRLEYVARAIQAPDPQVGPDTPEHAVPESDDPQSGGSTRFRP